MLRAHYPMASEGYPELGSLTTLSYLIGPRSFIRRGRKKVYPNIMGFLIGESSTTMKSSVIDYNIEILKGLYPGKDNADRAKTTRIRNPAGTESLEASLSRKSENDLSINEFWWYQSEQGTLMATMKKEFGAGIADDLTLLFDMDEIHKDYKDAKKDVDIPPMYVAALWGATPSVCINHLIPIHAEQGYLQRPAVVFGVPKRPTIPLPTVTPSMTSDFEAMAGRYKLAAAGISHVSEVEHVLDSDAKDLLDAWESDLDARIDAGSLDGASAKRGLNIALKVVQVNEYANLNVIYSTNTIDMTAMDAAIKESEVYITGGQELRSIISDKPDFTKAKLLVRKLGQVDEVDIMKSCHIEDARLVEIGKSLKKMKLVSINKGVWKWK